MVSSRNPLPMRKPLSDRTNTIIATTRRQSPLKAASAVVTKPLKPSFSRDRPTSSLNSNTSTGSNNPPIGVLPLPSSSSLPASGSTSRKRAAPAEQTKEDEEKSASVKAHILASNNFAAQSLQVPSSATYGSGSSQLSGTPVTPKQRQAVHPSDNEGTDVLLDLYDQSLHPENPSVLIPESSVHDEPPVSLSLSRATQTYKDKGKGILVSEGPDIEPLYLLRPPDFYGASSSASGGIYWKRSGPLTISDEIPAVENWNMKFHQPPPDQESRQIGQIRHDRAKEVFQTTTSEVSPQLNACNLQLQPYAAPGKKNDEKVQLQAVRNQRSSLETTNKRIRKGSMSCPPGKRGRDTRIKLENNRGRSPAGSLSDPRPVCYKKRRGILDPSAHTMPLDDIEKLRAYYADVDAFELPVEVASEDDLE